MEDLLERYRRLVPLRTAPEHPEREQYLDVCRTLSQHWSSADRFFPVPARAALVGAGSALLISFILNAAAGCITAWQLAALAYLAVFIATILVQVAAQNAGVTDCTDLWAQASGQLRSLALECGADDPGTAVVRHDAALAGFVDRGRLFRAKMFGLTVDFGLLRALVATAVTIAVGLFGILRGAGLRVTLETFCPMVD